MIGRLPLAVRVVEPVRREQPAAHEQRKRRNQTAVPVGTSVTSNKKSRSNSLLVYTIILLRRPTETRRRARTVIFDTADPCLLNATPQKSVLGGQVGSLRVVPLHLLGFILLADQAKQVGAGRRAESAVVLPLAINGNASEIKSRLKLL